MGRRLRQQRRGHGSSTYRSPSHRHVGEIKHPYVELKTGTVLDIMHAPGRNSPVAEVQFEDGKKDKIIAVEGLMVGQEISVDGSVSLKPGKVITIPAGVKHWHGAKKDSWFSHIAIEVPGEETSNEWLETVDDETYVGLE